VAVCTRRKSVSRVVAILICSSAVCVCIGCAGGSGGGGGSVSQPATVDILPVTATIPVGTNQPFNAVAFGTTSMAVSWGATAGTIDQSGNYTAPSTVPAGGVAKVTATSVSSPSASATATVTITTQPVTLTITPSSATVKAGFSQMFTALVSGTTNALVNWTVSDSPGDTTYPGSITAGSYLAPAPVTGSHTYMIDAVSNADPAKTASATVTVIPLENQEQQALPIKLGTSGVNGNAGDCCSGTLGSLLTDQNGKQYILSNNHVLGRLSSAKVGEPIVQPGFVDTFCDFAQPNVVAHFTAAPPIDSSNVDAAIAEVVPGAVDSQGDIIGLGGISSDGSYIASPPANTTVDAAIGMAVAKSGRTTGLSCGTVLAVDGSFTMDFPADCGNPTRQQIGFSGQVIVGYGLIRPGDSGSLIVDTATSRPVGLVAGLSTDGVYTTANPASEVLSALGTATGLKFTFVGGTEHAVSCTPASATQAERAKEESAAANVIPSEEIAGVVAVNKRHRSEILQDPAVVGIAVGRSDLRLHTAAILVFVEKGKTLSSPLPATLDGVEVRIVPTSRFQAVNGPRLGASACGDQRDQSRVIRRPVEHLQGQEPRNAKAP